MRFFAAIIVLFLSCLANAQGVRLSVQTGHSSTINTVQYNHDYTLIGSCASDNNVAVWDIESGKQHSNFTGHKAAVMDLVFHPKKDVLYSVSLDSTMKVWDVVHGELLQTVKFDYPLSGVDITSNGNTLAIVGSAVAFVSTDDYSVENYGVYSEYLFNTVSFSEDDKLLAFGGKKERFGYVADVKSKTIIAKFVGAMNDVIFDRYESNSIYYAAENGTLVHYNFVDHETHMASSESEWNSFNAVCITNRFLIGANDRGDVILYYRDRFKELHRLKAHLKGVRALDVDKTGQRLITAGEDKRIILWDLERLEMVTSFKSSIYRINHIEFSKDEEHIVIGFANGFVRRTNLRTNRSVSNRPQLHRQQIAGGWEFLLTKIATQNENSAEFDMMFMRRSTGIEGAYDALKSGKLIWNWDKNKIAFDQSGKESKIRTYEKALRRDEVLSPTMFMNKDVLTDHTTKYSAGIEDRALRIYDKKKQEVKMIIPLNHSDRVTSVAINSKYNFVATSSWDGMIKFWSLDDGRLLTTYGAFGSNDFVYINSDNYYFASKGALDNIGFLIDGQIFSFDQFDLKYNRPDLVFSSLPYIDEETIENYHLAYKKRLTKLELKESDLVVSTEIPVLKIDNKTGFKSNSGTVSLEIFAKDSIHGLQNIHALINGVPIWTREGKKLQEDEVELKERLKLNPGENTIQLFVTNKQGVSSFKKTIKVVSTQKDVPSDLYLITLGCSKYQQSEYNLSYAEKDASDIVNFFDKTDVFREVHTKKLINEDVKLENLESLADFVKPAGENDVVLLFVAGHGVLDANLDYYIASHDMDFLKPEEKGIPIGFFDDLLDNTKSRKKLMFIDACHSGEIDKTEYEVAEGSQEDTTFVVDNQQVEFRAVGTAVKSVNEVNSFELSKIVFADMRESNGSTVVSSAGGGEYAMEGSDWNNGVFTHALLKGLETGEADLNNDKIIMLSELQDYLVFSVNRLTRGQQTPTSRVENLINDFRIH